MWCAKPESSSGRRAHPNQLAVLLVQVRPRPRALALNHSKITFPVWAPLQLESTRYGWGTLVFCWPTELTILSLLSAEIFSYRDRTPTTNNTHTHKQIAESIRKTMGHHRWGGIASGNVMGDQPIFWAYARILSWGISWGAQEPGGIRACGCFALWGRQCWKGIAKTLNRATLLNQS